MERSLTFNEGKSVTARIMPGTDLTHGIIEICNEHNIVNGAVLSVIGTLKYATIIYVVPAEGERMGVKYVPPTHIQGPHELLAVQGFIGSTAKNERSIHLHGSFSAPDMRVYGGHFVGEGNPVLVTAEVLIRECIGVKMIRDFDQESGFELFNFSCADEVREL
jgi:uncharacterized protein